MKGEDILRLALDLKPVDRFAIVEGIIKSLDEPDTAIDDLWGQEAEARLIAYRTGKLKGISMEDVFRDDA